MFFNETIMERRAQNRIQIDNPVRFESARQYKSGGGLACNISEEGIQIKIGEFLPRKTRVNLKFSLNPVSDILNFGGQVVWIEKLPYTDRYVAGVRFREPSTRLKEEIQKYINSRQF